MTKVGLYDEHRSLIWQGEVDPDASGHLAFPDEAVAVMNKHKGETIYMFTLVHGAVSTQPLTLPSGEGDIVQWQTAE